MPRRRSRAWRPSPRWLARSDSPARDQARAIELTSVGVLSRLAEGGAEVIGIRNPNLDPPAGTAARLVDGPVYREFGERRLALVREFPGDVVSAYGVPTGGGGHDHRVALVGATLVVTPGSPNLPVRHGTVAVLTFADSVDVEIIHLPT